MQHNVPNTGPAPFGQPPPSISSDPSAGNGFPAGAGHGPSNPMPNPNLPFNVANLDPFTAKQMAALQATSLAKAANRSAPGGTSASYFGGLSSASHLHVPSNPALPFAAPRLSDPAVPPHDGVPPFHPLPHSPDVSQAPVPHQPMNPSQPQNNPAAAMQQQQQLYQQRRRNWLNGLATLMIQRGTPLPPPLTGVPFPPGYDPANMPWKSLEVSPTDLGIIRLAGKDIDLFKLWQLIIQAGGGQKVSQKGAWPLALQTFDLPEAMPAPNNPAELQPTAAVLERYYTALLGPFEEAYRKNMMEQSQRAALAAGRMPPGASQGPMNPQSRPGAMPGMPGQNMMPQANTAQSMDGALPGQFHPAQAIQVPSFQPPNPMVVGNMMPSSGAPMPGMNMNGAGMKMQIPPGAVQNGGAGEMEHELESRKRKMQEAVESEAKRARQKTGGSDVSDSRSSVAPPPSVDGPVAPTVTRTIRQPSRRKIEYVPFAREIDTAGGRDLDAIQNEWHRMSTKPVRHIDEWGQVDIDALTLSLRSRVSTEVSYALTTFTILTLLRAPDQGRGFPIMQAPDLLDEMVDLVEDLAFDGVEDMGYAPEDDDAPIVTHRELVETVVEDGTKPFAALERKQGARDPGHGPRHRPAEVILVVLNIIRNLSVATENQEYLAKHPKLLHVLLRLCSLAPPGKHSSPLPLAEVLSLNDLISIRKDVMNVLLNIALHVNLNPASPSKQLLLTVRRAYEVLASYIVDVTEAVSPLQCIVQTGIPPAVHQPKPPALADMALETFSRFTLPDDNRQVVSKAVPQRWLWTLLEALVHRLPVADSDFQVIMRDVWLTYVERLIMALYSLAFLAPPAVKERAKRDGQLGFAKVMLRLVKKFTVHAPPELRHHFAISVRRAIEAMKVVDDARDAFDAGSSQGAAVPTLAFGMGYGEHGDSRVERGMGLLSGYQEDITLGLMMHPELVDAMLFSELESLVRVGR
ncbi:hypothetical protein PYCCODRAFT_1476932 [Trametes coccinea BRFM310]|uniref:ARID domain-containing protein n=1 Tax=Trametes coccinea (strain BRFM310) TaxID=1353009 RepID=A0A1Y2IQX6_TRAC3|nr:hypothetical protein PYCCODRAFT_1476932 [Trametes coccinea BRFM310]